MVVLDENTVVQIKDMVVCTAHSHGIFLNHAYSRPALAGVGHPHVKILDQIDVVVNLGGES